MQQGFNPTFRIQGKLYHRLGNILPPVGNDPEFAHIFFHDSVTELTDRLSDTLDAEILGNLKDCLYNSNSYIQSFKSAIEFCAVGENLQIVWHAKEVPQKDGHTRTYNLPTSSEIAALLPGNQSGNLGIILRCSFLALLLYQIVTSQNIHDPYGNSNRNSPCMDEVSVQKTSPSNFRMKQESLNHHIHIICGE